MMAWLRMAASRIHSWISPQEGDREFEQEMANHLEMLTQENIARGMSYEEAQRAARIRLGGSTQLREANRELRGLPFLETLSQDLRYALRMLRKSSGFTLVAVLTLALGIGANTAIFSVVYAVLLKPLPYEKPEQLFTVFQRLAKGDDGMAAGWSYTLFDEMGSQNRIFQEMAGVQFHQLTLTGRGEPFLVDTSIVTSEFFSVFQPRPILGRAFLPEEGKPGAPATVILSENLWRSTFGADSNIVGTSINLDKRSYTVIGVMPAAFRFPQITESDQIWIPLAQDPLFGPWMSRPGGHWLRVTARLKPGVTMAQARAELDELGERFAKEYPDQQTGWVVGMAPLQQVMVGNVRPALLVLLGAVGLVLLIACANLANLLLARGTSRAREFALRSTLGAGRGRLIRQLMSETAALGLLGGATGIALAYWGVHGLTSLLPEDLPLVNAIRVDYFVLGFAAVLSAVAVCGFGLAPAFLVAHSDLQSALREDSGRSGEGTGGRRARNVLAAGELALAMVLLVAAGLLLRSFAKLTAVSPGFDTQNLIKANISLPRFEYATDQQWLTFSSELLARVQAEPGLQAAALAVPTPLADGYVNLGFDMPGKPPLSGADVRTADYVAVSVDYFRVMRIPLLDGRTFEKHDIQTAPRVALISKAFARMYFPDEDPIGKAIKFGFPPDGDAVRQIVGVVGDVRDQTLGSAPGPMMYVPFAQAPFPGADVVVRSSLDAGSVAAALRRVTATLDKDLPVSAVGTMSQVVDASVAQPRFRTFLLALFAGMAVILAATGIFGVFSYSVSCRTREIGVRVALGASRGMIVSMVLREILILTLAGLVVGGLCALAASRLLGHLLFGISASDPITLAAVAFALVCVAALAGYVPVRRAMSVDPMEALRHA
jgi:putative ABC transport system permease protein